MFRMKINNKSKKSSGYLISMLFLFICVFTLIQIEKSLISQTGVKYKPRFLIPHATIYSEQLICAEESFRQHFAPNLRRVTKPDLWLEVSTKQERLLVNI